MGFLFDIGMEIGVFRYVGFVSVIYFDLWQLFMAFNSGAAPGAPCIDVQ